MFILWHKSSLFTTSNPCFSSFHIIDEARNSTRVITSKEITPTLSYEKTGGQCDTKDRVRLFSCKVSTLVELLASSIMCKDEKQGLDVVKRLLFCHKINETSHLPFLPFWHDQPLLWYTFVLAKIDAIAVDLEIFFALSAGPCHILWKETIA